MKKHDPGFGSPKALHPLKVNCVLVPLKVNCVLVLPLRHPGCYLVALAM